MQSVAVNYALILLLRILFLRRIPFRSKWKFIFLGHYQLHVRPMLKQRFDFDSNFDLRSFPACLRTFSPQDISGCLMNVRFGIEGGMQQSKTGL